MSSEATLRAGEMKKALLEQIDHYQEDLKLEEVGEVLEVKDGVARIWGLSSAVANEMLEVESSETGELVTALALNLEEDNIGAVVMGDYLQLKEGDSVRCTGRVLEVPVGPDLLGRVVNPLGEPVDGKGAIKSVATMKVDRKAPGIVYRQPVKEPLQTGIKAIDSMIPIGRGQRELIIGDRATGKTTICIDTIINQARLNKAAEDAGDTEYRPLYCIYVAIGQKDSSVAGVIKILNAELTKAGIKAKVTGRPKHINSIYRKMLNKKLPFSEVVDVYGVRIVVDTVDSCYRVLGAIRRLERATPRKKK